jgi:amidophosphoribosyltransferase
MNRLANDPLNYRDSKHPTHCIFELIYFSRPDSFQYDEDVFYVRENLGSKLAEMDRDLTPDLIVPVPDSSNFIAFGYAKTKQMSTTFGLIRNHYVGRTFIKPIQSIRDESVRQKFNILPHIFKDKIVVLIDDSIVRGTTIKQIIDMIYNAGAREIHLRIGSPQVKNSCYYGIDTPTVDELIANKMSIDDITKDFNLTSLKHISMTDILKCVKKPEHFCSSCFSGSL